MDRELNEDGKTPGIKHSVWDGKRKELEGKLRRFVPDMVKGEVEFARVAPNLTVPPIKGRRKTIVGTDYSVTFARKKGVPHIKHIQFKDNACTCRIVRGIRQFQESTAPEATKASSVPAQPHNVTQPSTTGQLATVAS